MLFRALVGNSPAISKLRHFISRVSRTPAHVLLLGPPGSGHELVARQIHYHHCRSVIGFRPLTLSQLPAALAAYQQAEAQIATVAIAESDSLPDSDRGEQTWFIDISDTEPPLPELTDIIRQLQRLADRQVRLVLQCSAGRVVQADWEQQLATWGVRSCQLPALNERQEGLPLLIHEIQCRMRLVAAERVQLSAAALKSLQGQLWPQELDSLVSLVSTLSQAFPGQQLDEPRLSAWLTGMAPLSQPAVSSRYDPSGVAVQADERAMLTSLYTAEPVNSSQGVRLPEEGMNLPRYLAEQEALLLQQALAQTVGDRSATARLLGISLRALHYRLKRHGLRVN